MRRYVCLIILLLGCLATPSVASAGQYEVQSCMNNYSGSSVWNYFVWGRTFWSALNSTPGCGGDGGLGQGSIFNGQPSDLEQEVWGSQGTSGYYLDAPSGTSWTYLTWQQRLYGQGGGNRCLTANDSSGNLIGSSTCISNSFSLQDTGWQSKVGSTNTGRLYFTMGCLFAACTGGQNNRLYGGWGQIGARLTDNSAPNISDLGGVWGKSWIRGNGWGISWNASDSLGIKIHQWLVDGAVQANNQICNPTFYNDYFYGSTMQPCPNPGQGGYQSGSFPVSSTSYSDGAHSLTAQSYDTTSNVGSAQSTLYIDNSTPGTPSFTGGPAAGSWSNDPTPTYSFSASAISGISAYRCGVDGASATPCATPTTLAALTDGTHTLCVAAANNAVDTSSVVAWGSPGCTTVKIDTVAPGASLNQPAPWLALSGTTLTGSASDPTSGLADVLFQAQASGSSNWINLCNPPIVGTSYSCAVDGSDLSDGVVYKLRLLATNNAGSSTASAIYNSTADLVGPSAPVITSGPADNSWLAQTSATYSFSATDPVSGVDYYQCSFGSFVTCASPKTFTGLSSGWNNLSFRAVDNAGNVGAPSNREVGSDLIDPLLSLVNLPPYISGSVTVTGAATDSLSGVDVSSVKLEARQLPSGTFSDLCSSPSRSGNNYSCPFDVSALSGDWEIRISGSDNVGNVGTPSTDTVTVDNDQPSITLTNDGRVDDWLVTDAVSGINPNEFEAAYSTDNGVSFSAMEDGYWNGASSTYRAALPDSVAGGVAVKVRLRAQTGAGVPGELISSYTVPLDPPLNLTAPVVSGVNRVGENITSTDGTWSGLPPITVTLFWLRCDTLGEDCQRVAGPLDNYTLANDDAGHDMRSLAHAQNGDGEDNIESSNEIGPVNAISPSGAGVPTLSPTSEDKTPIMTSNGNWSGTTPLTFTYAWKLCNSSGLDCSIISGQNEDSYTPSSSDVGKTIVSVVVASNEQLPGGGTATQISAPSSIVLALPPSGTAVPVISGELYNGQLLNASTGSWSGSTPLQFTYQWVACSPGCFDIQDATGATFTPGVGLIGQTIKVRVTASNSALPGGGSSSQTSISVGPLANGAPTSSVAPALTGVAAEDDTLSVNNGTWTGAPPITYSYQFQRCDSIGQSCANIVGALSSSYTVQTADIGSRILAIVKATNNVASVEATSNLSAVVVETPDPPANTSLPLISGTDRVGETLTTTNGDWTGRAPIDYSQSWQRCSKDGADCSTIATGASYDLTAADGNHRLRSVVQATNRDGDDVAYSQPTDVIETLSPTNDAPPYISGDSIEPGKLTANVGVWGGAPTIDYAYNWLACRSDQCASFANDPSVNLTAAQVGATIKLVVTATNSYGSSSSTSPSFGPIEPAPTPPQNISVPTLTGQATVGSVLVAGEGVWEGTSPISYSYSWLRCSKSSCSIISRYTPGPVNVASSLPGAITTAVNNYYTLTNADKGYSIRARVEATNVAGTGEGQSSSSGVVQSPACLKGGAVASGSVSVSGARIKFYGARALYYGGKYNWVFSAKANKKVKWYWRLEGKYLRTQTSTKSRVSFSNNKMLLGQNVLTLTIKRGSSSRKIVRSLPTTLCPTSKKLSPRPSIKTLKIGSRHYKMSVSQIYSVLKKGTFSQTGSKPSSILWSLDGKKISSKNKVYLSPTKFTIAKHKITVKIRRGHQSRSYTWSVSAANYPNY